MKLSEQVAPQLMAPGELVTVPVPVPVLLTVRINVGAGEKVAVTEAAEVPTLIVHVPVPVQAPLQIPEGALLTEPEPVPARVTLIGKDAGIKLALTDCAALIVTEQVPVPLQPAPLQPAKTEAAEVGVAVS